MAGGGTVADGLRRLIHREGPVPFSRFVEAVLYDPAGGFFARGRGPGRAGRDFVTSPEVGPLFGVLVGRALDAWWDRLGHPDPFVVVEGGAGPGRLAREVLRGEPACAPALRYVLVERSPVLRAAQRDLLELEPADEVLGPYTPPLGDDEPRPVPTAGPLVAALDGLPAGELEGIVLANELLDNLPFDVAERVPAGWVQVHVGVASGADRFVEVLLPAPPAVAARLDALTRDLELGPGTRLPVPVGADAWLLECGRLLRRGVVLLADYAAPVAEIVARSPGWLRTYRDHEPGAGPLDDPGEQDVTADLVLEQVEHGARRAGFAVASVESQAEWLAGLGIAELVEEGRRIWTEGAHRGDLAAIAGRSRVSEAAALTARPGLGDHRVITLTRGV